MYEVEIKVEITHKQRKDLIRLFNERGFVSKGVTPQNDYYVEAKKSPISGYDIKRYRNEGGKYLYTQKTWEIVDGQPARQELQHEVSKEAFESALAQFPDAQKIIKDREWFACSYENTPISTTIDTVKFDHSPDTRYFIEGEIDIADKSEVTKNKDLIISFLKDVLNQSEIVEAPTMFTMVFEKK